MQWIKLFILFNMRISFTKFRFYIFILCLFPFVLRKMFEFFKSILFWRIKYWFNRIFFRTDYLEFVCKARSLIFFSFLLFASKASPFWPPFTLLMTNFPSNSLIVCGTMYTYVYRKSEHKNSLNSNRFSQVTRNILRTEKFSRKRREKNRVEREREKTTMQFADVNSKVGAQCEFGVVVYT